MFFYLVFQLPIIENSVKNITSQSKAACNFSFFFTVNHQKLIKIEGLRNWECHNRAWMGLLYILAGSNPKKVHWASSYGHFIAKSMKTKLQSQNFTILKIALNRLKPLPDDASRRELLISWFKSPKGAFCVGIWQFYCKKRILVPMSYITFLHSLKSQIYSYKKLSTNIIIIISASLQTL